MFKPYVEIGIIGFSFFFFFFCAIERVHFKARIYPNKYMAYDMPPDLKCLECVISPNLMRERERERERGCYMNTRKTKGKIKREKIPKFS